MNVAEMNTRTWDGITYHFPCDHQTYRLYKRLRYLWFLTVRRYAASNRWEAKLPKNRKMAQPLVPPFMIEKQGWTVQVVGNDWIDNHYRKARYPTTEPQEQFTTKQIEQAKQLLDQLEEWYSLI